MTPMRVVMAGLSHRNAPLAARECVAMHPQAQRRALARALAVEGVAEALALSTCGRTEIYAAGPALTADDGLELFRFAVGPAASSVTGYLSTAENEAAIRHLLEVAAGADSMVIGEAEVLGQVRAAAQLARDEGTLGTVLGRLCDAALRAGKRARAETAVARGAASVASAAVAMARRILGDLCGACVLVLGAGHTAELSVRLLVAEGAETVIVSNRTYARAAELAGALGGEAIAMTEVYSRLACADVVIGSTAAPHHVLHLAPTCAALQKRLGRPTCFIDLALPRDIDPAIARIEGVSLFDVDDLRVVAEQANRARLAELPRVLEICREEGERYWRWLSSFPFASGAGAIREHAEAVRRAELAAAGESLRGLTPAQMRAVQLLTRRIVRGIIEEPLERALARAGCDHRSLQVLCALLHPDGAQDAAGARAAEPAEIAESV